MYPSGINGRLGVANVAVDEVVPEILELVYVTLLIVPPVIVTLLAFWLAIVPTLPLPPPPDTFNIVTPYRPSPGVM